MGQAEVDSGNIEGRAKMRKNCFKCKSRVVCEIRKKIYKSFDEFWHLFDGKETLNDEIYTLIASHCQHYEK